MKTLNITNDALTRTGTLRAIRKEAQAMANEKQTTVELCCDDVVLDVFEPQSTELAAFLSDCT